MWKKWESILSINLVVIVLGFGFFGRSHGSWFNFHRLERYRPSPSPSPDLKPRTIKWGAYTGYQLSDKINFEQRIGSIPDMSAVFVHWGNENEYPQEMADDAKAKNQTLVIYWEAKDYNNEELNDSRFSYDSILAGNWDDYIESFGQSIKDSGGSVILIPFEEVNGDWNPWSITVNDNSPAKHIAAYRRIHDLMTDIPNLKFGWVVNNDSVPDTQENSIANLYPGSEYVDYLGVDGFNFDNPWQSFNEVFDKPLAILKTLNKPIMIFSMASAQGEAKPAWIEDMTNQLISQREIEGFIWFNESKEKNWLIWSDANSLSSFQSLLQTIAPFAPIPD